MGADGVKLRIDGEQGDLRVAGGCPCSYAGRMGKNMGPIGRIGRMGSPLRESVPRLRVPRSGREKLDKLDKLDKRDKREKREKW